MLNERIGQWGWRLLMHGMLISLTGCAYLDGKYSAQESNKTFFKAYGEHVAEKNKSVADGAAENRRLKRYDELASGIDLKIRIAREGDTALIGVLSTQQDRLRAALKQARLEAGSLAASTKALRKQVERLDATRKTLADTGKDVKKLATIEDQLAAANIELETRVNDDAIRQEDIAALQADMAKTQEKISSIIRRDYVAYADQERQSVRNEIIHEILLNADTEYLNLRAKMLMGRASGDTLLDITELTLSTATTLSGGAMAKANLGAASTLLKGSRSSVDRNFFAQQALAAIINAIDDRRQVDKTNIIKGLGRTTTDYTLQQALADAKQYESRASMMSGVLDLSNQTANKVKDSERDLEKEKKKQETKE